MAPGDDHPPDAQQSRGERSVHEPPASRRTLALPGIDGIESIEYRPDTESYRTEFDPGVVAPSDVVVHAVATIADCSPLALDCLYTVVDPDALDAILGPARGVRPDGVRVTFAFAGHDVTLDGAGVIDVAPAGDDADRV